MNDPIYGLAGLAMRAGKIVSGEDTVIRAMDRGQVRLLLIAEDASRRLTDFFTGLARKKNIPLVVYGKKDDWGWVLGKKPRSLIAVTDDGFAKHFLHKLEEM